jgi:glycosyltransferase involved in cell wall biosynthesis
MKPRVSASIICRDEEHNIEDCLRSVAWCDEIVVVDSGSTDRTVELAQKHTGRVLFHEWPGYVAQKNFALDQCSGDWVLSLDADERCTAELREAVERELPTADGLAGFEVRRHVKYLGRWINHGGWYPDWRLRVVRKGRARWGGTDPHDKLIPEGPVRRLDAEIHHFTYRDFAHQIRIINHFSDVVSEDLFKRGKGIPVLRSLFRPPWKFFECYVWKLGFLDGFPGFVIAAGSAFYIFARYVKLWERRRAAP